MNFIEAYELFASGNEASPTFHTWGAIGTLSAVIGRRIWFDQKYYKIYPNTYIVFVGEPGDKKTTALNVARGIVQKTDTPISPPSITKEALTLLLSKSNEKSPCLKQTTINNVIEEFAHLSIFASEIVTMLSAGGNPIGMIEFLTDIYDREVFEVATKNKGTDMIIGPYITLMACMTPEQTGQMLKQSIITGGFSRRVVFIYGRSKPTGIPFPELSADQEAAKLFIMNNLTRIHEWRGEFTMTEEAREFFKVWYQRKHQELNKPYPAAFKNWLRSKDVILIKVAMLLVVSEFTFIRVIELRHLQHGLAMLDKVEPDIGRIFAGAGRNVGADLAHKVQRCLEEAPGGMLPRKNLLALMYSEGNVKEIDEALDFLSTTGRIRKQTLQGPPVSANYQLVKTVAQSNGPSGFVTPDVPELGAGPAEAAL